MDKFLDKTGLTYFWNKIKSLFVKKTDEIEISTASPNSTGTAKVGEAVTDVPNYIPSGEITFQNQETNFVSSVALTSNLNNNYLVLGVNASTNYNLIPQSAIFNGNGVNFIAEIKDGD